MKKISLLLIGGILLVSCNQEKTAYVNNTKLIQEYKAMQAAEKKFTAQSEQLSKELDSVALKFQQEVQAYQQKAQSMSAADRQKREQELMQKQQKLRQQEQVVSSELRKQSDQVIDSLVTEVKGFVAEYGKEHGYTYIFGSTEAANIMYAKEGKNITETVLEELNKTYEE